MAEHQKVQVQKWIARPEKKPFSNSLKKRILATETEQFRAVVADLELDDARIDEVAPGVLLLTFFGRPRRIVGAAHAGVPKDLTSNPYGRKQ